MLAALLLAGMIVGGVPMSKETNSAKDAVRVDWQDNRLTLLSPRLPGGKVETWYLEAFCRRGSTHRKWEETTIPHKTERLDGAGTKTRLRLKTIIEGGVEVHHDIRVVADGLRFDVRLTNTGKSAVDVDWAQPCLQVASFTGRTQETYLDRCFIFTDKKERNGLTLLSELPRAEEAIYHGGQVFVPKGIDKADVNPRPLSTITPANNLIGCFSADDKTLLAMAWSATQELFQGVITCVHADFRIGGLKPGETKRITGKLYLMNNDTPTLLRHYKRDFPPAK
jgi:hypothetical protein